MFQIDFADNSLKEKFADLENHFPPEVCSEILSFLEVLRRDGDLSHSDCMKGYFGKTITKISAKTFELQYQGNFKTKVLKILDIKVKSLDLLKTRFTIQDFLSDKDLIECIPQYDNPDKIIKAIELINQDVEDTYQLGLKLGHKGKKEKYIARHGQYAHSTLEELKLIKRTRKGRKLIPEVTEKGKLIANAPDQDTKKRLLIEAMLNYQPVWKVIGEVTEAQQELTDELVKKLVFPEEDQDSDTSNRRAQTIKNWVKWISKFTGIPIHLPGQELQLTIPGLYSQENTDFYD